MPSKGIVKNVPVILAKFISVTGSLWEPLGASGSLWEYLRVFRPESQCGQFLELTGLMEWSSDVPVIAGDKSSSWLD